MCLPEKLKLDYLKNEKSFQSEIKKHFSLFHKSSLLDIKQTSKNKEDTTFNKHQTTKQTNHGAFSNKTGENFNLAKNFLERESPNFNNDC